MSFICLALVAISSLIIVIDTFRLGISPMPSNQKAVRMLVSNVPKGYRGHIYELGCGFGLVAIHLARSFPKATIIAYEKAWVPFLVSYFISLFFRNLTVYRKNFFEEISTHHKGIFFCYLFPKAMQKLAKISLKGELFSNAFSLPGRKAHAIYKKRGVFSNTELFHYKPKPHDLC